MEQDTILWQDRGGLGPLHVRRDGEVTNYKDRVGPDGKPCAKWFMRREAEAVAEEEGLPFEEVAGPDAILWKDEGEFGPVHVRRAGEISNYKDSKHVSPLGRTIAEWFTREDAIDIADKEGLPFEEA